MGMSITSKFSSTTQLSLHFVGACVSVFPKSQPFFPLSDQPLSFGT